MFCEKCGNRLTDNSVKFCEKCGNPVGFPDTYPAQPTTQPIPNPVPQQVPNYIPQQAPKQVPQQTPPTTYTPATEKKKTNKAVPIAIAVVVLLVVISVVAVAVFVPMLSNDKSNKSDKSSKRNKYIGRLTNTDAIVEIVEDTTVETTVAADDYYYEEVLTTSASAEEYEDSLYIFPSDTKRLSFEILGNYSPYEINLIANEIYARHGYIFADGSLNSYFCSQYWYTPRTSSAAEVEESFSDLEKANLDTVINYCQSNGISEPELPKAEEPEDEGNVEDPYEDYSDDFLFPTHTRLLSFDILDGFTRDQIDTIANEAYARHGYDFGMLDNSSSNDKKSDYNYFSQFSWYYPSVDKDHISALFTTLEDANLSIINRYREHKGWKTPSTVDENPEMEDLYVPYYDFIFDTRDDILTFEYLSYLSDDEIRILENEAYARHGLDFSATGDYDLYEYFCQFSWYNPCVSSYSAVEKYITKMENTNLKIIAAYCEM